MKIAFWSPFSFSGRKSTNLLLMALMAAGEGKEQLVLHVNAKESGPEHYLLSGRNREHLLQNGEFGLGFLEQMLRCERFDKSLVVNSAYSFAGGRVHVLPAGNVNGNGISVNELACAIAKRAEKVFQNVFLEVPSGCQNSSLEICRNADLVVVNISQSLRDIQSLDHIPPFSREFYLIGAYEKKCSYTMHNLSLLYPRLRGKCAVIPYHRDIFSFCMDGRGEKILDFPEKKEERKEYIPYVKKAYERFFRFGEDGNVSEEE